MESSNPTKDLAGRAADVLNPFTIFTALYVLAALSETALLRTSLYVGVELAAASFVALYVFALRRGKRVGDFWLSDRHERLVPAVVLLAAFAGLLAALYALAAPEVLFQLTLSMGLAAACVAAVTLFWKASAHAAVAGHAAAAGMLVLGPVAGALFVLVLPAVLWSRTATGAHTLPQALAGTVVGAIFALMFLV